jgi:hypothetical protein
MRALLSGLVALVAMLSLQAADDGKNSAPEPPVSLILGTGRGTATPERQGASHLGGGNIHVTQPSPDTLSVTMTGVVVAKGHPFKESEAGFAFELAQAFDVAFQSPKVKGAKLVMWTRVIGLLRCEGKWCRIGAGASISAPAEAAVFCGPTGILALSLPPRSVGCGEHLSLHDRSGPVWAPVVPGSYALHQTFGIAASRGPSWCAKAASAEFAPDPALESDWISKKEPFHGAAKKDFGFQVILKVIPDDGDNAEPKKPHSDVRSLTRQAATTPAAIGSTSFRPEAGVFTPRNFGAPLRKGR